MGEGRGQGQRQLRTTLRFLTAWVVMPFTEIENSIFREEYELNLGHVKFIVLLRYAQRRPAGN